MADPSKTEKATPKRREELRGKGQTAKSQELNTAILFIVAIVFLRLYFPYVVNFIRSETYRLWHVLPHDMTLTAFLNLMTQIFAGILQLLAPLFLVLIVTAVVTNLGQVGLRVSFFPLMPDISKLNPVSGLKKLFSPQPLVQLAQNLVKITIFVWLAASILTHHYQQLLQTMQMSLSETGRLIGSVVWEISWKLGLVMLILAIVDITWQRWFFERSIRMSKQEIKDEQKNAEGDPQIKAKIRQLQRKAALKRMMEAIPRADVVLTNPTHLAVAIEYKPEEMNAPQVVAKGAGAVAERIKERAREYEVPILENKPLARALFRSVEVGDEVPAELYAGVSEVLIYVYQLTGRLEEFSPREL
ncbi:flagellar biosynthesis protein FlhB [bacterium (Candidatus Blackallbacteria) CG17_big_fil_post_rev_8_21_14_2_50_48_46]|uniref:Flagellar biosynthetic protein FlhB n=1 Tax=bacterium (Candidatus Blackallbacteria) CG17_big_fil_post_rev_8_21_14_2_50_48_46 TaxID=2014261 RepID=A0A2M7G9Y6_9BACT|nr:MAG: flagellar biosynthesis protein FlhB [bacterium (Candidatus Blackallbacteria) CG18_big_fil_WC_8_21_14_2_50_49_26]PIW18955.1 MAG: flagellar biosynthesis protein FlhB [bacterium (Candidatus Blackallbacteria) CG17_big_fil_post_rev_8_21_14_2_50_48_46]PIW44677.1 MAG: flagellar biosynthesis protein FlhB [bacterium (Candidatus Blackallbacteria) CG13_big_fil_rev_8_21_14_2_50_49_14]